MFIQVQIISIEAHPDPKATKLKVTKVNTGKEELQVATTATNLNVGDKVVLATIGHVFPEFTIELRKLRGVESYGMFCGEKELGLPETTDGVHILSTDAIIGQEFKA